MKFSIIALLLLSTINLLSAEEINIETGEYEITLQMTVKGLPDGLPASATEALNKTQSQKVCIKDKTPKGFIKDMMNNAKCEILTATIKENTINWTGKCAGNFVMTSFGSIILDKKSFKGETLVNTKIPGTSEMKSHSKYSAHKLGECK